MWTSNFTAVDFRDSWGNLLGKMHEEEQKVAEEVWEPPVEIENSEAETEEAENAETSTESAYWFIPQASDCLISDEEKEQLYVTRDGGRTFEEMKLPMDLVSELPQIAIDCGFTVEDFDYLNMPEKEDDTLTITVTTDAAEKDGIVFQSTDYGATWEYKGLVQIAN